MPIEIRNYLKIGTISFAISFLFLSTEQWKQILLNPLILKILFHFLGAKGLSFIATESLAIRSHCCCLTTPTPTHKAAIPLLSRLLSQEHSPLKLPQKFFRRLHPEPKKKRRHCERNVWLSKIFAFFSSTGKTWISDYHRNKILIYRLLSYWNQIRAEKEA